MKIEKIKKEKFKGSDWETKRKFRKSEFSVFQVEFPGDASGAQFEIAQSDCPELKYVLAAAEGLSLRLLSQRDSVLLLQMKNNVFGENADWLRFEASDYPRSVDLRGSGDESAATVQPRKALFFVCPFWKSGTPKTLQITLSLQRHPRPVVSLGRLLVEGGVSVNTNNGEEETGKPIPAGAG